MLVFLIRIIFGILLEFQWICANGDAVADAGEDAGGGVYAEGGGDAQLFAFIIYLYYFCWVLILHYYFLHKFFSICIEIF